MVERLKSYGELSGVDIYRYEGVSGALSGIIFGAEEMLLTARHIVDSRMTELPGAVRLSIKERLSV